MPINQEVKKPALSALPLFSLLLVVAVLTAGLSACGPSAPPPPKHQAPPPMVSMNRANEAPPNRAGGGGSQKQRQADFLNRIRSADPQSRTIDRAVLNDQNELGLILDRSVSMDSVPALLKTMLGQMAREFPGQDLDVTAYAPSNPPMKIGTARLDARTRDMTYTQVHP